MDCLYFKQFLELTAEKPNMFSAMKEQLGVDMTDMKGPQWAGNISLGNLSYNGIMYNIVRYVKDPTGKVTGAMIRPMNLDGVKSQRSYLKVGDQQISRPDSTVPEKEQFIAADVLNKLMTQGFQQPAGGGGAGMLPGGLT